MLEGLNYNTLHSYNTHFIDQAILNSYFVPSTRDAEMQWRNAQDASPHGVYNLLRGTVNKETH